MPQIDSKLIFITLLIELGVAAAVSSSLARSQRFQKSASDGETDPSADGVAGGDHLLSANSWSMGADDRAKLPCRRPVVRDDDPAGHPGRAAGRNGGGAVLAIPAVLHHEYWALPVNLAVAAISGAFGRSPTQRMSGRSLRR